MARTGRLSAGIAVAFLVGAACGVFLWEPWHGPVIVSLSSSHGVDTGDLPALPLVALAVAVARARDPLAGLRWAASRGVGLASAIVLGGLLLVGGVDTAEDSVLVPAGGGTFDGSTKHADGRRSTPVKAWSHVALSYDGATLRLYFDGTEVSSRAMTGTIRRTTDPLWIGGSRPYGEYFEGVIDEVRVYDRGLSHSEVNAEMSRPIASGRISRPAGLVGAYGFDAGSGTVAADASGRVNSGTIIGATWTTRGRFGGGLRFDGTGEVVRIPGSASLNLRSAMTLSAWIRPTDSQSGWRTILHRQTDAYFLMAGGGRRENLGVLDNARTALFVLGVLCFCLALASGRDLGGGGWRRSWWPPVGLFVGGSAVDAALAPSATVVGPTLVAIWFALAGSHRGEVASISLIAALFMGMSVVAVAGVGGVELANDEGGIARSVALGLLLVTVGVLGARYGSPGGEPPGRNARAARW